MKYLLSTALIAVCAAMFGYATMHGQQVSDGPRYTAAGELIRPADFREWMFVPLVSG